MVNTGTKECYKAEKVQFVTGVKNKYTVRKKQQGNTLVSVQSRSALDAVREQEEEK